MTPLLQAAFEREADCSLASCSAEALIVLRLFAFRTRDLPDVETVVLRQRGSVDWAYIETQLSPLAEVKGQPEIVDALRNLRHT